MMFNFELLALSVGFVWLLVLTAVFIRMFIHYNRLTKGASNKTLKHVLEELLQKLGTSQKDIATLIARCEALEKKGMLHIQKVGLLRFNPFKETGGDQSFILSLVDGNDTGVVISGLYSRSGTRWYAKRVVNGTGVEHDLSEEEQKALREVKTISSPS